MFSISITALAIAVILSAVAGTILGPQSLSQEQLFYQQRFYAVHQLLEKECPDVLKVKRQLTEDGSGAVHLEATKIAYDQMIKALLECRKQKKDGAKTSQTTTTVTTTTTLPTPEDCQQLYERGERDDGVYSIEPPNGTIGSFNVRCEFSDGHGWTVIHKRFNGSVDFYRNWNEYKNGFGKLDGEHWLGNDKIHALTVTNHKLNIYLKARNGSSGFGNWRFFYVAGETEDYKLEINEVGYNGTLQTGRLTYHYGMKFYTKDRDNDLWPDKCATEGKGGWWYNSCSYANLNGPYNDSNRWYTFSPYITSSTMRVTR